MSGLYCAQMTTDALLQAFIDRGVSMDIPWNRVSQEEGNTPERRALFGDLKAIATELKARKALDQSRVLMDHESRSVRAWAVELLSVLDPERARVARTGIDAHLSTQATLEVCARARTALPEVLKLEECSIERLIERFEDVCIRQLGAGLLGKWDESYGETSDRLIAETSRVFGELEARGALDRLLPLLRHDIDFVQATAADRLLQFAPDRAVATLSRHCEEKTSQWIFTAMALFLHRKRCEFRPPRSQDRPLAELLAEFIELADFLGTKTDPRHSDPSMEATRAELCELANDLIAFAPTHRLYRLLDDPSPYTRAWAFYLLVDLDV